MTNEPVPLVRFGPSEAAAAAEHIASLAARHQRGLVVCGPDLRGGDELRRAVSALAARAGWVVLADIGSPIRGTTAPTSRVAAVSATDAIVRSQPLMERLGRAEVVVQLGAPHLSKALRLWLEAHEPTHTVLFDAGYQWANPSFAITAIIAAEPAAVLDLAVSELAKGHDDDAVDRAGSPASPSSPDLAWAKQWTEAESVARQVIADHTEESHLADHVDQPALAATLLDLVPSGHLVYVSNSMPVRDLDTFGGLPAPDVDIHVHRGANGIDGLTSAAAGAALATGRPTTLYCGDLAFLHDIGGLITARALGVNLTMVVPDNNGGGIFSQLPIARTAPRDDFADIFHTPHGLDLTRVGDIGDTRTHRAATLAKVQELYRDAISSSGIDVIVVEVDHAYDRDRRAALADRIAARLR